MKNFVSSKTTICGLSKRLFLLFLCCCMIVSLLGGCSGEHKEVQKKFVVSSEKTIAETVFSEEYIEEEVIYEQYYDELLITEEGLHQFFYSEELICEAYVMEIVVGTTTVDEIYKELEQIFGEEIDWNLSLTEFAIGTSLVMVAGVVGGILGPSTYFVSFSASKVLQSAISGGIVNSVINVIRNGVQDEGLTSKSFAKYAIEGFSEGYMYAAFSSVAGAAIKNVVRYVKFNSEYGSYYTIKNDGSIYDLAGSKLGNGYYQDGNIVITKEAQTSSNSLLTGSNYSSNSVFETDDGNWCYTDDVGKIYRINNTLVGNTSYKIKNITYSTDSNGRIYRVKFNNLALKTDGRGRLGILDTMEDIGKGDAMEGDHRGHLIADQFDGDNSLANIVPMSANANLKDIKNIEAIWKQSLQAGKKVSGEIKVIYGSDSFRPTSFVYSYQINGGKTVEKPIQN